MHGGKLPRYLNQLAHSTPLRTEIVTKESGDMQYIVVYSL